MTFSPRHAAELSDADAPGRRARLPATVWLVTALFGLLLAAYSVQFPTYRAPDEPTHVDMVLLGRDGQSWPLGGKSVDLRVTRSYEVVDWAYDGRAEEPPLQAVDAPARHTRPSFADLHAEEPSDEGNQQWQHPWLYYRTTGAALAAAEALTPAGPWSFDMVVGFLRLVSAAMVLPLPLLTYLTTRRLVGASPAALAATLVPLTVPLLTHIGAAVNNDNLLVLLVAVMTWLAARVLTGDRSIRTTTAFGAAGGLALLTKGFALFLPLWVLVVYGLAAWRDRAAGTGVARSAVLGALAMGLPAVIGGWWWLRNLVVLGELQPSPARPPPAPPGFVPDVGGWLLTFVDLVVARFWGVFGWRQASLPSWLMWLATLVLLVAVAAAFVPRRDAARAGSTRDAGVSLHRRTDLAALLVPFAGIGAIVVYGAWTHYAETAVHAGINGRYLYPALVGLAAASAVGLSRLLGAGRRWLPLGVLVAAGVMQLLAARTTLLRYWGPAELPSERAGVAALLAWSPWPPAVVVGCWVGIVAVGAALVVHLVLDARRAGCPVPARSERTRR